MRKILLIVPLLVGVGAVSATEVKPKVEITKVGIKYALDKNYAQLMKYSILSDKCFKNLSDGKHDDLTKCESYQLIVKDIQVRIEELEGLKRRYYK